MKIVPYALIGLTLALASSLVAETLMLGVEKNNYVRDGMYADIAQSPTGTLAVAARGTSNNRKTYLRFELDSLNLSPEEISDVSLNLTVGSLLGTPTGDVTLRLFGVISNGGDFDPETLTWNNAPYQSTSAVSFESLDTDVFLLATSIVDTNSVSSGDTVTWSSPELTNLLKSSTGGSVTLMITALSFNDMGFNFLSKDSGSVESGTIPRLEITVIPEPTSFAILTGLISFLLVFNQRRCFVRSCCSLF